MSLQQNNSVINSAFDKFVRTENTIILEGMMRLARAGLAYLVAAHDAHSPELHHPEESNTMAYAISHNGGIVASGIWDSSESGDMPGDAENKARKELSGTEGWVCIIYSDMENGWYRTDWEEMFLKYSSNEIESNFHRFFKRIK